MKPIEERESARKWLGNADPLESYSGQIPSSTRIGHSDNIGIHFRYPVNTTNVTILKIFAFSNHFFILTTIHPI